MLSEDWRVLIIEGIITIPKMKQRSGRRVINTLNHTSEKERQFWKWIYEKRPIEIVKQQSVQIVTVGDAHSFFH